MAIPERFTTCIVYIEKLIMPENTVKIQDHLSLRRSICEKDRKKAGVFYAKYYMQIKYYIASRVPSITDAEDLTQDVFIEFYKSYGYKKPEAYLLGIAKNLVAQFYRSKKRQVVTTPITSIDEIGAKLEEHQKPAEQVLQHKLTIIKDLILQLPPKTREAIRLRFIEELSLKEAAKQANCSVHTFCQRIYEAKRIIQKFKSSFE
ncbi:RNA polymerase sigma factor [Planctomycetota bacterium]